jgi:glycosyltransferase involved in cell wall biosynthesis
LKDNHIAHTRFIDEAEIPLYFNASDLNVLPYRSFDAQSGVGLTALAFGTPLLVTRVGGLEDLVRSEIGILEPKDPHDMAMRILEILKDPSILRTMKEEAEKLANEYGWEDISLRTAEVYKHLRRT